MSMVFPCLIRKEVCKTPIDVKIEGEGLNKYGEKNIAFEGAEIMCNYQDCAKSVLTADKKLVQLSGVALIPGDIAPKLPALSGGTVTVFGVKRRIYAGTKARNPDGTVNYVELKIE